MPLPPNGIHLKNGGFGGSYVPQYDPWFIYGAPLGVWPGWYPFPGLYLGGPGISLRKGPRLNPIAVNLPEGPQKHNMDSPRHIARLVCIPEPSAVLTMEASRWRTLPAGDRALVAAGIWEGGMWAVGMEAVGEGSSPS